MRSTLRLLFGLLMLGALGACSVLHDPYPPVPPYDYSPVDEEIEAAARLDFDSSRYSSLSNIAQRPYLTPREQAHLVRATYAALNFENHKTGVLLTLIDNPCFAELAASQILRGLNRHLAFDSSRTEILQALDRRASEPPPPPPPPADS